jgi:hypothetical protein
MEASAVSSAVALERTATGHAPMERQVFFISSASALGIWGAP